MSRAAEVPLRITLHRRHVTLFVSVYSYTKAGGSKLCGTTQLRLHSPDANGRIALTDSLDALPAGGMAASDLAPDVGHAHDARTMGAPQGPFRMVHCTAAQRFALAFNLRVVDASAAFRSSPAKPGGRLSSLPGVNRLLSLYKRNVPPPSLQSGVSDPADIRISRASASSSEHEELSQDPMSLDSLSMTRATNRATSLPEIHASSP